jgi:uncharacterized protein
MTVDEIAAALRADGGTPSAALTAALVHADALAPSVYAVAEKLSRGVYLLPSEVYLLPSEANLLLYGLNVLAAARHPALLYQLLALAALPIDRLDQVFPHHTPTSLQRLLLTVWDGDPGELFELIEHGPFDPDVKWALYSVLARLTFDGRIARQRTLEFLARIERDGLIEDGDMTWWGWAEAVERLGLIELEPALRRAWTKPIFAHHTEGEREETLEGLRAAAASPDDPTVFNADDIRPISDPVEAVAWIDQRAAGLAAWDAEHGAEADDDVAKAQRLTGGELDWVCGFLNSPQAPPNTMPFEMLDGFLTALVIGPVLVPPSEYVPEIWRDDGSGPTWDSPEQAQHFFNLLMKHWNAIAARRAANAAHAPYLEHFGDTLPGEQWAGGFLAGIDLRADAWQPIFDDHRADQIVLPIIALSGEVPDEIGERMTPEMRETTLAQLPAALQMIAAYWRSSGGPLPRREPPRSVKVGRNEPCPCGSGKKFKRCCGSASPSTLH